MIDHVDAVAEKDNSDNEEDYRYYDAVSYTHLDVYKRQVINGCPAHCASYGHFDVKGRIYMVWDYSQIEEVKKQLMEDSKLEMEDL